MAIAISAAGKVPKPSGPDVPLEVVQSLLTRVIWQAVADLGTPGYRREAEQFFGGETFAEYCDILDWNVRRARDSLRNFVDRGGRISGNHLLPTDRAGQPLFPNAGNRRPAPKPPLLPEMVLSQSAFGELVRLPGQGNLLSRI